MADLANARPIARYGDPNQVFPAIYGPIGVAANSLIYGGALVGTDASGNMIYADTAGCTYCAGVSRKTYYNRMTDPSGGAAGAVLGEILAGAFPFTISTDGGSITNANRWQPVYVVDNQTVSLSSAGGRLLAGYILTVDSLGGPTNGLVWVQVGEASPSQSLVHVTMDVPLATLQAKTSGTAFTIGTLPTNFVIMAVDLNLIQVLAGGTVSAAHATVQSSTDSAGTILASTSIFTGVTLGRYNTAGSAPIPSSIRGGQTIQTTVTLGTDTNMADLTTGHFAIDFFGALIP